MFHLELQESLQSIINDRELYSFHQNTDDFISMYFDNFPSLVGLKFKGNFKNFFRDAASRYGFEEDEMMSRLVFHQFACPDTMEIGLWAVRNILPNKLSKMKAKYIDYKRTNEIHHTLLTQISYCTFNNNIIFWDVTKMTADEIIDYLGAQECFH